MRALGFVVTLFALLVGCAGESTPEDPVSASRLNILSDAFYRYQTLNRKLPENEQQIRQLLEQQMDHLSDSGIGSVDEVFVSERDGQPYTVLFGKDVIEHDGRVMIAYEQTGVEGKRLVAFRGGIEEMDDMVLREILR